MSGLFEQLKQYFKDAAPGGSLNPEITPQSALDTTAMSTMAIPVVGDVAGLASDVYRMYKNPEERTLSNAALMGLGVFPFIPAMGTLKAFDGVLPAAENAKRTQIIGTLPTYEKAASILEKEAGKGGRTLDFGAGLGEGAKKLGENVHTFEPFPNAAFSPTFTDASKIPSDSYDKVTNFNVLNVVPKNVRDDIVSDIGRVLAPGGTAIITTRGKDVMGATGKLGPEPMSIITSRDTYQKGFTQKELTEYVKDILGSDFSVTPTKLGPAGVVVKKKKEIPVDLFEDPFKPTIK